MFKEFRITSPYGQRVHPISGEVSFHTGIDLVRYHRSPIQAFVAGVVTWAGWGTPGSGYNGFGNIVAARDKNGYTHIYAHLDSINVSRSQNISQGTTVGRQGATGIATGSHLHYEVRQAGFGTHVDPTNYLTEFYKEVIVVETCKVILDETKYIGEGLLYNGRSYLPVRALENTRYVVARWDGPNKTVYLRTV